MIISKFSFVFYILFFGFLKSQSQDSVQIKSYEEQVMVKIYADTNIENFTINYKGDNLGIKTKLFTNNSVNTSFSVDYKFISASVSFAPKFIPGNNDNNLKGKSSFSNIVFRFFPKKFIQTVYYKNVNGFYLENTQDFIINWRKGIDPYFQFPDLKVQSFGGSTSYIVNNNFSLKSIYYQREWQKQSSGSLIPNIDYELLYFKNKNLDGKSVERQINIGGSLGYYYNWVINNHINIAPFAFSGMGGKFSNSRENLYDGTETPDEINQYFTFSYGGGLHVGYNSNRWLWGSQFNFTSYNYNEKSDNIMDNNFYGLLYLGYRFAPPKAVKKEYDQIKEKVPVL